MEQDSSNLKICAGIVTYNPDIVRLQENFKQICNQVDLVLICDNGSKNINKIRQIITINKAIIIELKENKGIATALNKLCKCAYKKGYDWIITLDQDSVCPNMLVQTLRQYCSDKAAVIGPRIIYRGNEKYSAENIESVEKVEWIITSGSLTNLHVWDIIGGFDDLLFIDKVDTDYCIRANQAGYEIIRDNQVILNHELGDLKCRKLFGRVIYVTNHLPFRIYYQCRNTVYISAKLKCRNSFVEVFKIIIKICLYEDRKIEKLKQAIRGILDGRMLQKKIV